jgi:F0F1-type ATP synthase membrane subunit c/vacuolar-type H+-ATPase subunit K
MASGEALDGEGVRAGRARRRRMWKIVALAVIGAGLVDAIMLFGRFHYGLPPGHMTPAAAIAAAVLLPVVMIGNGWAMGRSADEFDRMAGLRAARIGLYSYLVGGCCWIVLAAGGITSQPNNVLLLLCTASVTVVSKIAIKLAR